MNDGLDTAIVTIQRIIDLTTQDKPLVINNVPNIGTVISIGDASYMTYSSWISPNDWIQAYATISAGLAVERCRADIKLQNSSFTLKV
jgi:hypothetical protein